MSREVMKMAQELEKLADRFSEGWHDGIKIDASDIVLLSNAATALREALEQPASTALQLPAEVAATITTTDIAWLETRRLTKLWKELGQMRWAGADEGWDRAVEAVRSRLNDECQAVLDWKAMADQSNTTAIRLLQKMQGRKHD